MPTKLRVCSELPRLEAQSAASAALASLQYTACVISWAYMIKPVKSFHSTLLDQQGAWQLRDWRAHGRGVEAYAWMRMHLGSACRMNACDSAMPCACLQDATGKLHASTCSFCTEAEAAQYAMRQHLRQQSQKRKRYLRASRRHVCSSRLCARQLLRWQAQMKRDLRVNCISDGSTSQADTLPEASALPYPCMRLQTARVGCLSPFSCPVPLAWQARLCMCRSAAAACMPRAGSAYSLQPCVPSLNGAGMKRGYHALMSGNRQYWRVPFTVTVRLTSASALSYRRMYKPPTLHMKPIVCAKGMVRAPIHRSACASA